MSVGPFSHAFNRQLPCNVFISMVLNISMQKDGRHFFLQGNLLKSSIQWSIMHFKKIYVKHILLKYAFSLSIE